MKKQDSIKQLRGYLSRLFDSRYEGTETVAYAQNQGFADGYMQAMTDLAMLDNTELLKIVGEERSKAARRADGTILKMPTSSTVENFA